MNYSSSVVTFLISFFSLKKKKCFRLIYLIFFAGEAERIKRCKGRVFALQDEPEVPRVWLPFDDAPGLAMARAFGDFCLKEYGVISIPEFSHRMLTERDQFIVLASDGVCLSLLWLDSIPTYLYFVTFTGKS